MSYLAQLGYAGYRLGKKPGLNPASQVTPNDLSVFLATSFIPYQILTYAVHGGEEKRFLYQAWEGVLSISHTALRVRVPWDMLHDGRFHPAECIRF